MKRRVFSVALALCLCVSAIPGGHAWQESPPARESASAAELPNSPVSYAEGVVPTPQEAYGILIGFKDREGYTEGTSWTDENHSYTWNGGVPGIPGSGTGCVAFAYELSDAVFGNLPARMCSPVKLSDVKVGDILRVNFNTHSVIVLQVSDAGVTVAEGNVNGMVHWGRTLTKAEVEAADNLITRYPEGYTPPDDPSVDVPVAGGSIASTSLTWKLTKSGTLTIAGTGAMPDFSSDQPWSQYSDDIVTIVIENGVTSVGAGAFRGSRALSVIIPASVKTIRNSAFQNCSSLISATIPEGVESIGSSAFSGCTQMKSIALPASVGSVGDAAFMGCAKLTQAAFASGSKQVRIGDNLFTQCYELKTVTLPARIDRIGVEMFRNCGGLSELVVPQGAERIEMGAFSSCVSLKSVTIPDSVTEIGIAAFADCGVTDIYYGGSEAQWANISKLGDSNAALAEKKIHYNSAMPEPDPGPDPNPGPDPGPGHTHAWDGGSVTKPAACTVPGVRTYTCTVCGETREEAIPAAGHRYGAFSVTVEATCAEAGERTAVCPACGDTKTEAVPPKGHKLVPNGGDYECANEVDANGDSVMVVAGPVGEGYLAVKARDGHRAPYTCQDVASAQRYAAEAMRAVLGSVSGQLSCTVTTIRFTPPTRTADGEYIYRLTVQSSGRAVALSLTTEPLRVVIPALGVPVPDPTPRPDPAPETEETYSVDVPKTAGGKVAASVRYAAQGDRVILSAYPEKGYELTDLTVTDRRGREVSVQDLGDNRFRFTMPGMRVEVQAVFTADKADEAQTALNPLPMRFVDVPRSEWYYSSVEFAWQRDWMSGISDTRFAPNQAASRAMIWTVLARMNHVSTEGVPGRPWYEAGRLWAMGQGVTDGANPMEPVTREQLAAMLWRNAGGPGGGSLDGFSDAAEVDGYAVRAVQWAVSQGILQGNGGRLNPKGVATRAEAAAMMMRYASGT